MTIARIMAIGQGASALPEDRFVNTFYFDRDVAYAELASDSFLAVADFFTGVGAEGSPQVQPISRYISPWVLDEYEMRAYNMADALPRVPTINGFTRGSPLSASGMPEEAAVCCTLHGLPPVTPRRRGRIYIGPLNTGALQAGTTELPSRPANNFLTDLVKACSRLADVTGFSAGWSIKSSLPTVNYVPIVSGYIDDAFHTQRRRGPDATSRNLWVQLGA